VAIWRLALSVLAGLFVAGCSTSSTTAITTLPPGSSTTTVPPAEIATTPTSQPCTSGNVNVPWRPWEPVTTVCVTVGSTLVLTGGGDGFGGTWPGPPSISNSRVLALTSSNAKGTNFTANVNAIGTGSATVEVPFVAGNDVCNPTPCTPVPGRPLDWRVTVVG
jgi:hypothetical protein